MSRLRFLAAMFTVLVIGVSSAFAKAPKAADTPSVEEICQNALKAIEDKAKKDADAKRDPLREAIDGYRDRKLPLAQFQVLVENINDAKTDAAQSYRNDAAQALIQRFLREEENDPQVRAIRRTVALGVLDLMKASKDDAGLKIIEAILFSWWKQKLMLEIHFKASDKLDDRKKAWAKMKKFLDKGETN